MDPCLIFLCLSLLIAKGVFGDEVTSVSVMEGESLTLHTNVTELQSDDVIEWTYGPENAYVAEINVNDSSISDDKRFRDRVKPYYPDGNLIISDITTQLSGLYQFRIYSNNIVLHKRFNVTVHGVLDDEVMSMSVRKGHPLILYTHELKESDDVMEWRFGPEHTLVARINGKTGRTIFSDDERFRGRLKRDAQTGALMINDTRPHHSGLYHLKINSNNNISYKGFNVTVYYEVSVREGHSVALYTHILEQSDDVMEWCYGPENTLVARINGKAGMTRLSTDERFRDRVKVEDQTGALMVSDTRPHHSGLYHLRINSNNKVLNKMFNITVHASERSNNLIANQTQHHKTDACQPFSDSRVPRVLVIAVLLLIVVCICVSVCVHKHRASHALKDDKSSINSSTTNVIYTGDEKKMLENLI